MKQFTSLCTCSQEATDECVSHKEQQSPKRKKPTEIHKRFQQNRYIIGEKMKIIAKVRMKGSLRKNPCQTG